MKPTAMPNIRNCSISITDATTAVKKTMRYHRQEILDEIGITGQAKLSSARVLVVGAGGLGCPVLLYLAGAGIGTLGVIDPDCIDISNLQRQVLYTTADAEKPKATVAAERLLQLNPDIKVNAYAEELTDKNAVGLFSDYDIIVDGTDNFTAKFLINDAAVKTGKPVVYGALQSFDGQVAIFDAARGACYRCLHPAPPQGIILNCAEAGVIGALAGIIGTVQAMEVIKLVVGHPSFQSLIGRLWMIDTRTMQTRTLNIPKQKSCSVCAKPPTEIILQNYSSVCSMATVEEITCAELEELVDSVMIDVRELSEWAAGHIKGATHLPLSLLRQNLNSFTPPENGKTCIIYCQKGGRSKQAAEILLRAGFNNIRSLKGGYEDFCARG
jgi:adenylyltransferase/sulfurtransferase